MNKFLVFIGGTHIDFSQKRRKKTLAELLQYSLTRIGATNPRLEVIRFYESLTERGGPLIRSNNSSQEGKMNSRNMDRIQFQNSRLALNLLRAC